MVCTPLSLDIIAATSRKINSILWKYIIFYKYVEQDGSLVIPSRSVNFFIENIDEEKWIQEYTDTLEEIIPFFFLELKTE
jgi:hypothetical protein